MGPIKYIPILHIFSAFYYAIKSFIDKSTSQFATKILIRVVPVVLLGTGIVYLLSYINVVQDAVITLLIFLLVYAVFVIINHIFDE